MQGENVHASEVELCVAEPEASADTQPHHWCHSSSGLFRS